jgi:hypothetical protein
MWFWIAVSVALIWNLLGTAAYLSEAFGMAQSDAHRDLIIARPWWATGAYALAVFGGVVGCIALLVRNRWALPVLLASFVALLVQQAWNFAGSGVAIVREGSSIGFAGAVVLVSFGLVSLAWAALQRRWLR